MQNSSLKLSSSLGRSITPEVLATLKDLAGQKGRVFRKVTWDDLCNLARPRGAKLRDELAAPLKDGTQARADALLRLLTAVNGALPDYRVFGIVFRLLEDPSQWDRRITYEAMRFGINVPILTERTIPVEDRLRALSRLSMSRVLLSHFFGAELAGAASRLLARFLPAASAMSMSTTNTATPTNQPNIQEPLMSQRITKTIDCPTAADRNRTQDTLDRLGLAYSVDRVYGGAYRLTVYMDGKETAKIVDVASEIRSIHLSGNLIGSTGKAHVTLRDGAVITRDAVNKSKVQQEMEKAVKDCVTTLKGLDRPDSFLRGAGLAGSVNSIFGRF